MPKSTLKIFDISHSENIILLGKYEGEDIKDFNDFYIFNQYAYLVSKKGLLIVEVSNFRDLKKIYTLSGDFSQVIVSGKYIYSTMPSPTKYLSSIFQILEIK